MVGVFFSMWMKRTWRMPSRASTLWRRNTPRSPTPTCEGRKSGRRTAGCGLHTPAPLGYRTSETLKSHGLWSRDPFKKRGLFSKWVFPKRGLRDGIFLAVWKEGLSEILGPYENTHCALLVLWKLNTRVMFTWLFGSDTTGYMNHQWQFPGGPQWPPTKWSC